MISVSDIRCAAVDLGNTRVKLFLDSQSYTFEYKGNWLEKIVNVLQTLPEGRIAVGVGSVRPEAAQQLFSYGNLPCTIKFVRVDQFLNLKNYGVDRSGIEGIGTDRILGLYGGLLHTSPPFITVDCGTAVTVNVLDGNRVCRGGAILPGVGSQLQALHDYTEQLPRLAGRKVTETVGTTTEQAMMIGVVRGCAGAVRAIVGRIANALFGGISPSVLLTGGDAGLLVDELADEGLSVQLWPELVREGIVSVTRQIVHTVEWDQL